MRVLLTRAAGNGYIVGTLAAVRSDSLFLELPGESRRVLAFTDVRRAWVHRGRTGRRTGRGAVAGALIGGLGLGLVAAIQESNCEHWLCLGPAAAFTIGFGVGAVPGAVIGGVVGSNLRSERWERVRLERARLR